MFCGVYIVFLCIFSIFVYSFFVFFGMFVLQSFENTKNNLSLDYSKTH